MPSFLLASRSVKILPLIVLLTVRDVVEEATSMLLS